MTKVVFCAYDTADGSIGGPIAWALEFIPFLQSAGFESHVLVLQNAGNCESRIVKRCKEIGVSCFLLDTSTKGCTLEDQIEWILLKCRQTAANVLVANLVLPALYAGFYLRKSGIRRIGVVHSNPKHDPFYRDFLDVFAKTLGEYLDVVVAVSNQIKELIVDDWCSDLRCEVIPCGCNSLTERASPPVSELRLLYIGRLESEQKRIRETTEALVAASELPGVTATICGDGREREWLIQRLRHVSKVNYIGLVSPEALKPIIEQHHVLVLLSDYEGLPIALLEGMSAGLVPICLANTSGVSEVVRNEVNGLLVEDREAGFIQAVAKLQNTQTWSTLSVESSLTVQRQYTHSVTFAKWKRLIDETVERTPGIGQIPRRVILGARNQRFDGYPANRATTLERLAAWMYRTAFQIRQFIRPRSRMRQLLKPFRTNPIRVVRRSNAVVDSVSSEEMEQKDSKT